MTAAEPFISAEQAWFWTIGALRSRRESAGGNGGGTPRPCDPDDVIRAVDRLWREARLSPAQLRVMRMHGERQSVPNTPDVKALWDAAMETIAPALRAKGIVA